jgi:DNA-binding SARP family transcriptional activator
MEFRILGALEVCSGGKPVHIVGAKQRSLLAMLLLHRDEVVSTDRLSAALWPKGPPATARKALHVHVSQLRRTLAPGERRLETRSPGYLIHASWQELDSARFEALVNEAAELAEGGDLGASATKFDSALALWRGPALADFVFEPFAAAEIARLEELRLLALERSLEAQLEDGSAPELVGELEALVTEAPLREHARAQLMLALYRSGRQADALETYRGAHRALGELGIKPGRELQRLERAILNHDPTLGAPGDRAGRRHRDG